MATNVVKKGANRAAHAEKTNRHAQRTPLPPRPGVVEAAREAIISIDPGKTTGVAVRPAENHGEGTDDRSKEKARAFAEKAGALGWTVAKAIVAGAAEVTATRGPEMMVQAWRGGVWDYTVSYYAYGDRNTKPRNASGAIKILQRTAEAAQIEASKVAANKHFRKAEPKDLSERLETARKALPFDPELATDEEVCAVLAGQALVWYNRLSRGQESGIVGRKGAWITYLPDGQRVVNFCCPAIGYRACLVTAILKVGRGRQATPKGSEHEVVEVD